MDNDNRIMVETFRWMQRITAKNNGLDYYMIGQVVGVPHTLLVTAVKGIGGSMMFCQKHEEVYPINGKCAECQNAVVTPPAYASVTDCYTP